MVTAGPSRRPDADPIIAAIVPSHVGVCPDLRPSWGPSVIPLEPQPIFQPGSPTFLRSAVHSSVARHFSPYAVPLFRRPFTLQSPDTPGGRFPSGAPPPPGVALSDTDVFCWYSRVFSSNTSNLPLFAGFIQLFLRFFLRLLLEIRPERLRAPRGRRRRSFVM